MTDESRHKDVLGRVSELSTTLPLARLEILADMAEALSRSVVCSVAPDSDIVTPSFENSFSGRLVLFHAMHDAALTKKTFEYMFQGASRAAGRQTTITNNSVHPGEDVIVNGTKFSLKTEGGSSIKRTSLHISKLMEARWIRDISASTVAEMASSHISEHLSNYQRIISLRSFKEMSGRRIRYELVEIPKSIFGHISSLTNSSFSTITKNGSTSAKVYGKNRVKLFSLRLDGSVEKVTISSLNAAHCVQHACWTINL